MGFDDDILQDFLVEAAEILEQLQEQLVTLEQRPADRELLNAIFRGFHTVKGGAGFLSLNPMVDLCHLAENLFDLLRNDQLVVDADLMDVVLQALDSVNVMFVQLQNAEELTPADSALLASLKAWCEGSPVQQPEPLEVGEVELAGVAETASAAGGINSLSQSEYGAMLSQFDGSAAGTSPAIDEGSSGASESSADEDIDDSEFEALLDQLHGKGSFSSNIAEVACAEPVQEADPQSDDDISESEFEDLLDQLHGKGRFDANINNEGLASSGQAGGQPSAAESPVADDDIKDDEFEQLLDLLHGKGQAPGLNSTTPQNTQPNQAKAAQGGVQAKSAEPTPSKPPVNKRQSVAKPEAAAAAKPAAKTGAKPAAVAPSETSVRVDTRRLDDIMNMVGELVLVRNRLLTLGVECGNEELSKALSSLDVVTADLQGGVMKTRMQPIKKVFGRFPRVVRDLARSLKKDIKLSLQGEETDLDKNLVEALADPLVHLVRNSVDHGIEMPDQREAVGKPREGVILLSAEQEGDHILLTIKDDGGGMDAERLKGIAMERGILDADAAARMPDSEAYNLIFAPGFSTKTEISDISGRGVGMDVVKTRIAQLNGSVNIDSEPGVGTIIRIKVPLTLAIMPTLMVEVSDQVFALPLACVSEIFHMDLAKTNVVDGQLSITVREKAIPLFYLDKWLTKGPGRQEREGMGHVVIVHIGSQVIGFVVERLLGQEEVVIKPLGETLQGTPGIAGATITSNGGIALILDVPGLLKHYARRF